MWQYVKIDFITPVPTSLEDHDIILIMTDHLSGFTLLCPLKGKSAATIAASFWKAYCDFEPPPIIQSDQDTEFLNEMLAVLLEINGICHGVVSAYNPRVIGKVECTNQTAGGILKKFVESNFSNWNVHLPLVQYCLNLRVSYLPPPRKGS